MAVDDITAIARRRDSAFAALVCAALGLIVLESANIFLQGSVSAHAISLSVGGVLVWLMFRSLLKEWPATCLALGEAVSGKFGRRSDTACLAACVIIAGAGYIGASALLAGWVSPFALFTGGLVLWPWHWVAGSFTQHVACWAATTAGVGGALLLHHQAAVPFLMLAFGCYLWMIAIACWARTAVQRRAVRNVSSKQLA